MRILVTGASGAIGVRLVEALRSRGLAVRAFVHRTEPPAHGGETVRGDLLDPSTLEAAVRGIDAVVHLAARTHARRARDYRALNVDGTRRLLDACRSEGTGRFVFMSSGAAVPGGGAYSESKLEAEAIVRERAREWVILRPREVYGPGMKEGIPRLLDWIRSGRRVPVIGSGRYELSPVHVDDVVQATAESVVRAEAAGRTFVLAGPESMTFLDLVDRLAARAGVPRRIVRVPALPLRAAVALLAPFGKGSLVPDQIPRLRVEKPSRIEEARRHLDFRPRSLEEGLARG
jgi:NADH dehydrogenase